jgi:hypothetical protein
MFNVEPNTGTNKNLFSVSEKKRGREEYTIMSSFYRPATSCYESKIISEN